MLYVVFHHGWCAFHVPETGSTSAPERRSESQRAFILISFMLNLNISKDTITIPMSILTSIVTIQVMCRAEGGVRSEGDLSSPGRSHPIKKYISTPILMMDIYIYILLIDDIKKDRLIYD